MNLPSASSAALFYAITAGLFGLLLLGIARADRLHAAPIKTTRVRLAIAAGGTIAWLAFTYSVAQSGALRQFNATPPRLLVFIAVATLINLRLVFSPFGKRLATGLSWAAVLGYQAFRIPVEIFLHRIHSEGVIPARMTWEGMNFDIVTGILALLLAALATKGLYRGRTIVLFNVIGLGLLVTIVVISALSSPLPVQAFHDEPLNRFVFEAPYCWLPLWIVQAALFGHLLAFRKLWLERSESRAQQRSAERLAKAHAEANEGSND